MNQRETKNERPARVVESPYGLQVVKTTEGGRVAIIETHARREDAIAACRAIGGRP